MAAWIRAWIGAAAAVLACTGTVGSAAAVDLNKSRLTSIELSACKRLSRQADGGAWLCPGLRGYPVYFGLSAISRG